MAMVLGSKAICAPSACQLRSRVGPRFCQSMSSLSSIVGMIENFLLLVKLSDGTLTSPKAPCYSKTMCKGTIVDMKVNHPAARCGRSLSCVSQQRQSEDSAVGCAKLFSTALVATAIAAAALSPLPAGAVSGGGGEQVSYCLRPEFQHVPCKLGIAKANAVSSQQLDKHADQTLHGLLLAGDLW